MADSINNIAQEDLKYFKRIFQWTLHFKKLTVAIAVSSLLLSLCSGIGLGMMIPFLQSINAEKTSLTYYLEKIGIHFVSRSHEMIFIIVTMLVAVVLQNILRFLSDYWGIIITEKLNIVLREQILNKMYESDYIFFLKQNHGIIANIFVQQVQGTGTAVFNLLRFFTTVCIMAAYFALLLYISWFWTLIALAVVLPLVVALQKISKKIHYYNTIAVSMDESITSMFLDDLKGINLIKLFSLSGFRSIKYDSFFQNRYISCIKHNLRVFLIQPGSEAILIFILATFMIGTLLIDPNQFYSRMPFVLTFLLILIRLKGVMQNASQFYANLAKFKYNVFNVVDLLAGLSNTHDIGNQHFKGFKEALRIEGVSFKYNPEGRTILNEINMVINPGETVAVVGKSGSGKTTLSLLILGLLRPTQGMITVDSSNLNDIEKKSYWKKIGIVTQETVLFNESIYWNIAQGKTDEFSLEDVRGAAKLANIDSFIGSLNAGYNTVIGDEGMNLSGGERQRLGIARAMIHSPELVIMDEPTSSLDSYNEKAVTEAIQSIRSERTVVIIAHRLSTVIGASKVVVMKDGRIDGIGTHRELLKHNTEYQILYKEQFESKSQLAQTK